MNITTALVAVALLGCGAAFAGTTPTAAPAPAQAPMAPKAPGTPATPTPVAKQGSLKACNQEADEKSLTGKERATFVKDCRAGKTTPEN
jgi:hypothetical protein